MAKGHTDTSPLVDGPPDSSTKRKRVEEPVQKSTHSKRRKSRKPKDIQDDEIDQEQKVNKGISRMDSVLLADLIVQRTKRFEPELSSVELEDKHIPSKAIFDTTVWQEDRTVDQLPNFLEKFAEDKLSVCPKPNGSPHTLVLAMAGLRAADLARSLRKFQTKDALIAKLFAKHIKLNEAIESCKRYRMNIGVGTPQRVLDLLEAGCLSTDHLKRIVLDASYVDPKKRGVMDMKEVTVPLTKLLSRPELKSKYGVDLQILFF
ncbi:hypothetical protein P152DRAFT_476015 [Eremomyces bilateralis CBS 781.70]|uniref:Protein CMS1 n=1 Tax=Eremomyces bilateralis CBS 781.70 TaxID=1392243 RepID=A0A6G1FVY1_9PEZI|nr:uncharacterized protein P152DRAFT_476015 [Eremomyces bilateralis CBS 781.70]KAF1809878.1 hypothetical protein P152DRAFT_476015 [Eremomyces bilateralis CBS 781.70]